MYEQIKFIATANDTNRLNNVSTAMPLELDQLGVLCDVMAMATTARKLNGSSVNIGEKFHNISGVSLMLLTQHACMHAC